MGMLRIAEVLTIAALLVAVGGRRMIRSSEEEALQSEETSEGTALPEAPGRVLSLPKATLQADEDGTYEWAEYDGCKYLGSNAGEQFSVDIPSNDWDLAYGMKMAVSAGADLVAVDGHAYTFTNLHRDRDGTEVALDPTAVSCSSVNQGNHQLLVRRSAKLNLKLTVPSCPVSASDESDCGGHGISESQCEDQGCCWAESHRHTGMPCSGCEAHGFQSDTCGCGVCGSYGNCSWSCTVSTDRPPCGIARCFHKKDTEPAFVWLNTAGRTHLLSKARGMLTDCRANMAMGMQEVIREVGYQGRELDMQRDSYNAMVVTLMFLPMGPFAGMLAGQATRLCNHRAFREAMTSSGNMISRSVFDSFNHLATSRDAQPVLMGFTRATATRQYGRAMASSTETTFVHLVEQWSTQINERNQINHQQLNDDFTGYSNQEILFTIAAGKWDQSFGDESTCSVSSQKAVFADMMTTVIGIETFGHDCPNLWSCVGSTWHKAWCHPEDGSTGGQFASIQTSTNCQGIRCHDHCHVHYGEEIPYYSDFLPDLQRGMGSYRACPDNCFIKEE